MAPTARWSSAASERAPRRPRRAVALPAAFHVELRPPHAWWFGCRCLGGLALWAALFWTGALCGLWPASPSAATACLAVAALVAGLCPSAALPGTAGRLSWDGDGWQFAPRGGANPVAGHVDVALDLGPALLLRFVGQRAARWSPSPRHWLPVAGRALSPDVLQALRVALYCRRPEPTRADHRDAEPDR